MGVRGVEIMTIVGAVMTIVDANMTIVDAGMTMDGDEAVRGAAAVGTFTKVGTQTHIANLIMSVDSVFLTTFSIAATIMDISWSATVRIHTAVGGASELSDCFVMSCVSPYARLVKSFRIS